MKWVKRLITSALIVSMALSSSFTSLAGNNDNLNDNTNSGDRLYLSLLVVEQLMMIVCLDYMDILRIKDIVYQ